MNVIDETQTMYNLTVDLFATYVVGEGQWVVHNQDIPLGFTLERYIASQVAIPNRIIVLLDKWQRFDKQGIFSNKLNMSPNFKKYFYGDFINQFATIYGTGNADLSIIRMGGNFDTPRFLSPEISVCEI